MLNVNNLIGFNNNSNQPIFVGGVTVGSEQLDTSANQVISLSGTLTGGIASSPSEGDTVIIFYAVVGITNRDTSIVTADYNVLADLYSDDTRDSNLGISWKRMGTTPDTSVTVRGSGSSSYGKATAIHVWRNLNSSNPVKVITTNTGINSSRAAPPTITPVNKNSIIIAAYTGTGDASQTNFDAPTGLEYVFRVRGNGSTNDCPIAIGSKQWYGESYTPPVGTGTNTSISDSWCAATLAIS